MHCKYLSALYGNTGGTYSARVFRPVMFLLMSRQHDVLSGSLSKSGPLHFGSENSFPSNFSQ